ncbi:MAG: beta-ketoacyl synthase chain length factor [Bacteroidetes bacterium]|nr:beta-ketoacyl synthase chain length factor [Bacteroidota bacterium]
MKVYINGLGNISPQQTHDGEIAVAGMKLLQTTRNSCIEPEYANFVDPKQLRRMSRIIRMGVASSILAMKDSGIEKPEAIIVGTAFGCLEDTYSFLSKLILHKEDMLSPTAFIHSTHNTIAAQVALLFQCRGYNSTYVHKSISFESALIDGLLLLNEKTANQVLVGGVDEIINAGYTILNRLGHYKKNEELSTHTFPGIKNKGIGCR